MSRRQRSLLDELFESLKLAPVWLGPVLAVVVYFATLYLPAKMFAKPEQGPDVGVMLRRVVPSLAGPFAGAVLVAWVIAEVAKWSNRRLIECSTSLDDIRKLSWHEFERLITEAYRRQGYLAEHVGGPSDGGKDIKLTRRGETVLVQCKQWKAWKVGVQTVREMLGVVVSERATKGIVVTSGVFTSDAEEFARKNPTIELVNGAQLNELIRAVKKR